MITFGNIYLSEKEYATLKEMGYLWEFYPEVTGDYKKDVENKIIFEKSKKKGYIK